MKIKQSVPKRRYINFRRWGIAQKKVYNKHGLPSVGCLTIWPVECTGVFRRVFTLNKDFSLTPKAQWLLYVPPVLTPTVFVPMKRTQND